MTAAELGKRAGDCAPTATATATLSPYFLPALAPVRQDSSGSGCHRQPNSLELVPSSLTRDVCASVTVCVGARE